MTALGEAMSTIGEAMAAAGETTVAAKEATVRCATATAVARGAAAAGDVVVESETIGGEATAEETVPAGKLETFLLVFSSILTNATFKKYSSSIVT